MRFMVSRRRQWPADLVRVPSTPVWVRHNYLAMRLHVARATARWAALASAATLKAHVLVMVATLKKEQADDDNKKEYCGAQLDAADDKRKELEKSLSDTDAAIGRTEEGIAALTEEIAALDAGIKGLDKSVAEATQQRKQEHEEFNELMASDSAA